MKLSCSFSTSIQNEGTDIKERYKLLNYFYYQAYTTGNHHQFRCFHLDHYNFRSTLSSSISLFYYKSAVKEKYWKKDDY